MNENENENEVSDKKRKGESVMSDPKKPKLISKSDLINQFRELKRFNILIDKQIIEFEQCDDDKSENSILQPIPSHDCEQFHDNILLINQEYGLLRVNMFALALKYMDYVSIGESAYKYFTAMQNHGRLEDDVELESHKRETRQRMESLFNDANRQRRNLKLESVVNVMNVIKELKQADELFMNEQFVSYIMDLNIKSAKYLMKLKKYNDLLEKMKLEFDDIPDLDEDICCDPPTLRFGRSLMSIYMEFSKNCPAVCAITRSLRLFGNDLVAHLRLIVELPDSLDPFMGKCILSEPAASKN